MTIIITDRDAFSRHAEEIRMLGSPFVAAVLEAGQRQLTRAPRTAALVAAWPGDRAAAALAMRFNGALHALVRRGASPELDSLYRRQHDDFDGAVGAALAAGDDFIAAWMRYPPQTNEVGRAASIVSALMVASTTTGPKFELLELGSSAGLNLNLAHYCYDLGGVSAGATGSPIRIAPAWQGPPPPVGAIEIVAARGVDLHPLDVSEENTRERLLSYVWADEPDRAKRLEQAIAIASAHPPQIDRGDVRSWLAEQLEAPQPAGQSRIIFHSMVMQYLTADDREATAAMIAAAGARATPERPLGRISFEWSRCRTEVQLQLTLWPDGGTRQLATCHPYGAWIRWQGA